MLAHPSRVCSECGEEKPLTEFYARKQKDAHYAHCKLCAIERAKASARRCRLEALTVYGGDPPECACCGETALEFLTLDHIDGNGATHRREQAIMGRSGNQGGGGGVRLVSWLRKHNFPPGFRVLCQNCNCALGFYGYCPHGNLDPLPVARNRRTSESSQ